VEGDWLPATVDEALRFFGSFEALDAELADIMEIDPEPGIALRMIRSARQSDFDERFERSRGERAMARFRLGGKRADPVGHVTNPDDLSIFVAETTSVISDEVIREAVNGLFLGHARREAMFFDVVEPNEAEIAANVIKAPGQTYYRFVADQGLREDFALAAETVRANIDVFTGMGKSVSFLVPGGRIRPMVRKLAPAGPIRGDLPFFSPAEKLRGSWHVVDHDGDRVALGLWSDAGAHVATLHVSGGTAVLKTPEGLHMRGAETWAYEDLSLDTRKLALDADRAAAEIEARLLVSGDLGAPPEDGCHFVGGAEIHVEGGVLHRANGPALVRVDGTFANAFRGVAGFGPKEAEAMGFPGQDPGEVIPSGQQAEEPRPRL
jgi:hypothetical protein